MSSEFSLLQMQGVYGWMITWTTVSTGVKGLFRCLSHNLQILHDLHDLRENYNKSIKHTQSQLRI